jgi:acyl-CoA synthetase (AMP-forming)/AMP-acid ligase II
VTIEGIDGSFLRTGDLGVIVEGQLFITGRRKDLIVVDGVNHHSTDLELTVELAHPALRCGGCAVVSVDERGQERVVVLAEMTTRALHAVDPAATPDGQSEAGHTRITAAVRRALSAHHGLSVHDIVLLPAGSLPFTSSGKLRRFACREGYQEGRFELGRVDSGRNGTDGAGSGRGLPSGGRVRVGRDRPAASRVLGG